MYHDFFGSFDGLKIDLGQMLMGLDHVKIINCGFGFDMDVWIVLIHVVIES